MFKFVAILIVFGLSGCSSTPPVFPSLCDMPPVPDMPSNEELAQEAQAEELATRPENFTR